MICAPNACDFVPQTFRAHCKSFCCFRSRFRALLQFCILLLYALYLHYAQFCAFCTYVAFVRYLFLHYNAFSHVHYHCIRYYAYDIIFIHLAFSAFCVCIILVAFNICCIRHLLHSRAPLHSSAFRVRFRPPFLGEMLVRASRRRRIQRYADM